MLDTPHSQGARGCRLGGGVLAALALVLTLLGAHAPLRAQSSATASAEARATGQVSGRISNRATGEYLRNARVFVEGSALSTTAGNGGEYTLFGVPAGEQRLRFVYSGLEPITLVVQVQPGQPVRLDADLSDASYDQDLVQLGRFVVSTEREGNAKAIMEQRGAVNMKKAIAADALGNVSEGNVGEFLKQLPGVAMDYVESEVRQVRIRGFSPKYASVTMDGNRVASAGSSDIGVGRAFEFEQLSIASVDTVEMSKTPTPDQPSTVAGTVNLRSKSAFDRKGRRIAYSTSLYFNSKYMQSKVYGWDDKPHYAFAPNAAFEYSDILIPDRLGVSVGINYSSVIAAQKNARVRSYAFDDDPSNNGAEIPRVNSFDFKDTPKITNRRNYNLKADYKLNDALSTYVKVDYNEYDATFFNRYVILEAPANSPTAGVVNAPDPDGDGPLLAGPVIPGVEYSRRSQTILGGRALIDGGANNKFGDTLILGTGFELKLGRLTNTTDLNYSRARNWYEALRCGFFEGYTATTPYTVDFEWSRPGGPQDPHIDVRDLPSSIDWRDPAHYIFGNGYPQTDASLVSAIRENIRRGRDRIWTARTDFRYPAQLAGLPLTLKFGASTTLNIRDTEPRTALSYVLVGPDGLPNSGDGDLPADWVEEQFHADAGWGNASAGWPAIDRHGLAALHKSNPEYFRPNLPQHLQRQLQNQYYFKERIDALYLQATLKIGPRLDLAPGIRYEYTDSWGKGPLDIGDIQARHILTGTPLGSTPPPYPTNTIEYVQTRYGPRQTMGSHYGDAFGYLHSTYRLRENLIARFSAHQAITRADIANLIPGIGAIDEANQRFNINNPELKPEMSRNFNASLEYYFEPTGVLSASVFRSDIEDVQRRTRVPASETIYAGDPFFADYEANIWSNVAKAHSSGLELDYYQQLRFLPGPLSGLSLTANYTHLRFDMWENFFGSPKQMWNTGLSYTQGRLFVSYKINFTGKKLFTRPDNGWDVYDGERLMMDVNLSYRLSERFILFANGRNITKEPISRYAGNKDLWLHYYNSGAMWEIGLKGSF